MIHRFPLAILCAAALLPAQNLLQNGDFSSLDAQGNPQHWSFKNFVAPPAVQSFDTAGLGASQCVSAYHGKINLNASGIGELIQTGVTIIQARRYELRADIAVGGSFNNDAGKFEFFVDGVSVGAVDLKSRGSKPANVVFRERVCLQFVPQKTNPQAEVRVEISRGFNAAVGRTPQAYIDNIFLAPTFGPQLRFAGERAAGGPLDLRFIGGANRGFAFFLAAGLLPQPVPVPGWVGDFALNGPQVLLLAGTFDAQGQYQLRLNAPAGAVQAYVQGGETGQFNPVELGLPQLINLY